MGLIIEENHNLSFNGPKSGGLKAHETQQPSRTLAEAGDPVRRLRRRLPQPPIKTARGCTEV
jgi:hypothetical protein